MKLVIGLGNPGGQYKNNRHNVGQLFIDWAKKGDSFGKGVSLVKTDVFMNDSGVFVKKQLSANRYLLTALYVVHDDLDIPLGQYKIQLGIGPKVHNGVNSVESVLGDKNFWRIRIGVDNRQQAVGKRQSGEKYVLEDFSNAELEILEGVFDAIRKEIDLISN